jgi:hypothetical protein
VPSLDTLMVQPSRSYSGTVLPSRLDASRGISIEDERGASLGVFQSAVVPVTEGTDLPSQNFVDRIHRWADQRVGFPCPLHEDTERRAPGGIQLGTFIAVHHQFGVVLPIHTVVWEVERANLPQQQTKGIYVGRKVVRFAPRDLWCHVAETAGIARELIQIRAPTFQGGI